MMILFLRQLANLISELERLDEILEFEHSLQLFDVIALQDLPVRYLWMQFCNLLVVKRRLTAPTWDAFHLH
jgi:hypothetical protein